MMIFFLKLSKSQKKNHKIMKKALYLFVTMFIPLSHFAQQAVMDKKIEDLKAAYPYPELTQEQMYHDFDTLLYIMQECNPQIGVIKKITGHDIIEEMQAFRSEIATASTALDFAEIAQKSLAVSLEGHATLAYLVWFHPRSYIEGIQRNSISKYEFSTTFKYAHAFREKALPSLYFGYSNENYYLLYTTVFYNKNDSVTLESGTKIRSCNGEPLLTSLAKERTHSSGWDFKNRHFFANRIKLHKETNSLQYEKEGQLYTIYFSAMKDNANEINRKKGQLVNVKWLSIDSALYIRLPAMQINSANILKDKILAYKSYPIKSVIIDIRGNSGGSDEVWMGILATISDIPLCFSGTVLINNTPMARSIMSPLNKVIQYDILDSTLSFAVMTDEVDTIFPMPDNIGYRGNIYLITDELIYSSAQVLASLASEHNRIRTVGIPTGKCGGRGTTPSVFVLPYSRFMFTLNMNLDASNVQKVEDFYHDNPLYPFYPSSDYYKYWYDKDQPVEIDEKSMYQYDELFIETLNIIDEERAKK
jgi:hypothetical protein